MVGVPERVRFPKKSATRRAARGVGNLAHPAESVWFGAALDTCEFVVKSSDLGELVVELENLVDGTYIIFVVKQVFAYVLSKIIEIYITHQKLYLIYSSIVK